jgi:carboxypeptidase Q
MKKIVCSVSVIIALTAQAQLEDSLFLKKLSDEIMTNGKAYDNLHYLTKNIGHRLSGSPQMYKAESWGLKVMKESGADKIWFQECMVPHWVRGGPEIAVASYVQSQENKRNATRKLDIIGLGNSIGTGPSGINAQVIQVNSFDELEEKKDLVKGKIVFYNYKFDPNHIHTFLAYRDAVGYRGQGPSRAAKYGASAVIIRSMTHATDNNPHTGSTRYDTAYARIPAVAIGLRDADWMDSMLKKMNFTVQLNTNGHFRPDTIAHNVIGELTGSEFPNSYITIGGHLDSWDVGEGAHDDGAGIVQTIEVLRALKAINYKPRHTIRFVLFANEENGLRGGEKYAEQALAKKETHIFAIESDAGGFTPRSLGFSGSDEQLNKFMSWKELIAPYRCDLIKGGGGADIGPLNRALKTPTGSLNPDSQRYFDVHHARSDVFENVNKRELHLGAVNMAALIYLIDKYGL